MARFLAGIAAFLLLITGAFLALAGARRGTDHAARAEAAACRGIPGR